MATSKTVQGDIEPGKEVVSEDPETRLYRLLNEEVVLKARVKQLRADIKAAQTAFLRYRQGAL